MYQAIFRSDQPKGHQAQPSDACSVFHHEAECLCILVTSSSFCLAIKYPAKLF